MSRSAGAARRSDWHLSDAHELAREHGVDPAQGLHEEEVGRRRAYHGPNVLTQTRARGPLALLADQFRDFMILVLVAAALISGILGDWIETLAILVIVLLNALIGFVQAWRADRAMAALRQLAAMQAAVLRDGQVQVVAASELVPGDIVLLEAGNQVPADLRLLDIAQLKVDESALTGESVTVEKHARRLQGSHHALGDRLNMAFKGTTATHGRGRGLVVATGMATELGQVAGLLQPQGSAAAGERLTPLQQRLADFGRRLALAVLGICALIFVVGVLRGEAPLLMMLTAVSLAVAAIPEALPAVVTVLLALGARRMARQNALVRRLPSVETLGSVTYICSDKTGTLTQNRMHVEQLWSLDWHWLRGQTLPSASEELLRAAALCNDARHGHGGSWQGDPTETALAQAAHEAGLDKATLEQAQPRVQELPFDSERKRMSTVHRSAGGVLVAYVKGAPESVLPLCTQRWHSHHALALQPQAILDQAQAMAAQGLRVLALARRSLTALPEPGQEAGLEQALQFIGLVGLIDPPRPQAQAAVRDCLSAGITPVMITGDHPATALAIAQRLGIVHDGHAVEVLTGAELATMDESLLHERVASVRVYARVDPLQKIRIVEALQQHGEFVAMTGDGVNDAPALKRADIGVAMGRSGTDVAREAASLVLLDDNFATIVRAVREGRRIYDNIRKFVRYALTGNSGEIWVIFLAPLLGLPIPLLPIHILWVNLVTDGLPGLALAREPAGRDIMRRPPRPPQESLFAHGLWQHVLWVGLLMAALCLGLQAWTLASGNPHGQSMVFTTLTLAQMAHVLAIRSEHESLLTLGLRSNLALLGAVLLTLVLQLSTLYVPALQPIFKTVALSAPELSLCFAAAGTVLLAVECEKFLKRRRRIIDA
jgi:Ca2+-transporting ATPase